jgi:hypothetical protein
MRRAGRLLGEGIRHSGFGIRHSGRAARAATGDCSPVAAACVCAFALSCLRGGSACSLRCARSKGRMRARRWGWGGACLRMRRQRLCHHGPWSCGQTTGHGRSFLGAALKTVQASFDRAWDVECRARGSASEVGGVGPGRARAVGKRVAEWRSGGVAKWGCERGVLAFWGWGEGVRKKVFGSRCARGFGSHGVRAGRHSGFAIRHSVGGQVGQKSTRPAFAGRVEGYMCISDVED